MTNKIERAPAAQADVHDAKGAPEGANPKPSEKPAKPPKFPKGDLFVVKENISGHIHSAPLPKAKAEAALKKIEAKERREHPSEKEAEFVLVEYQTNEN